MSGSDSDSDSSGLVDGRAVKVQAATAATDASDGSRSVPRHSSGNNGVASPRFAATTHASASSFSSSPPSFASAASVSGVSDANADMSEALEQIGYGRFQQRTLLPITGLTLMADAMELMLLPFLTLGVECEWGGSASGGSGGGGSSGSGSGGGDSVGDVEVSLLSTAVFMGMLVGALLSGLLSDRIGRRPTVLLLTACTGLFGLGSALAPGFHSLLFCRTLVGVGVGGSPAALSLFTEFLPRQSRGKYLVHYMLFFSSGAVLEVLLAWATLNALGWRALLVLSALPSIVLTGVVYAYCPESASWLLSRGQRSRASSILVRAFETNHPTLHHGRSCPLHVERAHLEGDSEEEEEAARSVALIPCSCGHAAITAHKQAAAASAGSAATASASGPHSATIQSGSAPSPVFSSSSTDAYDPDVAAVAVPSSSASSSSSAVVSSRSTGLPALSRSGVLGFLSPLRLVFSRELRAMSSLLCLLFFLMAFVYYSLVLLSLSFVQLQLPAAHTTAGAGAGAGASSSSSCTLDSSQYFHLFLSNLAEFPGLALCFVLLDRIGRRATITRMFLATAACIAGIPLVWTLNRCAEAAATATVAAPAAREEDCPLSPVLDWVQSLLLFGARACSLAFNQALWIYSTELFPAEVRSSGLGVTTVFARVGGAASPWVVQLLFWRSRGAAIAACVGASLAAAAVAHAMPKDTKGQELQVLVTAAAAAPGAKSQQRKAPHAQQQPPQSRRRPVAASSSERSASSAIVPRSSQLSVSSGTSASATTLVDEESTALNRPISIHPAPAVAAAAIAASTSSSASSASLPDALLPSSETDADAALSSLNLDILRTDDADDPEQQERPQAEADADQASRLSHV